MSNKEAGNFLKKKKVYSVALEHCEVWGKTFHLTHMA